MIQDIYISARNLLGRRPMEQRFGVKVLVKAPPSFPPPQFRQILQFPAPGVLAQGKAKAKSTGNGAKAQGKGGKGGTSLKVGKKWED